MSEISTEYLLISEISIDRAGRQRKELTGIEELAESMERLGQLQPIIVDRDMKLVAGERRLTAAKSLGWETIRAEFSDEVDPVVLHAIELEENVKRVNLSWQDECAAVLAYHEFRLAQAGDAPWSMFNTADALGMERSSVSKKIQVAKELAGGNELVKAAPALSTAMNISSRVAQRREASAIAGIKEKIGLPEKPQIIIQGDFVEWQKTYTGPKFNLIHCDFPYGIGIDKSGLAGNVTKGGYDDSLATYEALLVALKAGMANVVDESAHLVFWFSMDYYDFTLEALRHMGWRVWSRPLVWHRSDNSGLLPDPNRGPRYTYETAFFASRGDRPIVRAVANSIGGPMVRDSHMSEKPQPILEHFFRMLVDEHTRLIDPTAGSGSSIRAAKALGAAHVFGIEINPEHVERANERI